ncbi:MAG: response regulator receiver [Gemmatimonadetes bacterium]|nr:response regulator receiver [Gemmatimonadota bacterium]
MTHGGPVLRATTDVGRPRIIVVDDDEDVCRAIGRFLRARSFHVATECSGAEVLARLREEKFDLMLCDVRMPEMSGIEVLTHALQIDSQLAVLMLTAVDDAATATEALSQGAFDYLVKPVALDTLERAVERALHRRRLEIDRANVEWIIREEAAQRTEELERERRNLRAMSVGVADALINAMEAKDAYLLGHSRRVAELAASVAEALGLHVDQVEDVRLAGRLHDVGKIGIREEVLNKPGALTPDEFEHVKTHVDIGMLILAPLKHMPVVLQYVLDHHEHYDGSGYPRAIAGDQITIGGKILAACDAFDALTSRRAFREALEPRATIEHLESHVGQLLDPLVFSALKRVVLRRKTLTFLDDELSLGNSAR